MKIVPAKRQMSSGAEAYQITWRHQKRCINTEYSDIMNIWSTFHTFTIYWSLWETVASWAPADLYFVPMPARTALPPNANFGLSDWS